MFEYNEIELKEALSKYFLDENGLKLIIFPKKQKQKYLCLLHIMKLFKEDKEYKEKDINEVLMNVYPDYVMVRRYLIDYNLLLRKPDGSAYWVNNLSD